jgi:CRP-like cAMP-binding protein
VSEYSKCGCILHEHFPLCPYRHLILLLNIAAAAVLLLLQVMTREAVSADDVVIKQGDEGDKFYVVDSGCFAVSVIDRKVQ